MSDVPRSFDMQAPESRPVPVDTLKPAMRDDPPAPVREGLPPTFRMRADAHYVESLDMVPPGPKLQLVDVSRIDPRDASRAQPAPALVESIQSVGVLQPLIAEPRNGRFRLLAGVRRLAAARAAGLRDVPCIVRRADEDGAAEVTAAANLFVAGETAARAVAEPDAAGTDATRELARVLSSLSRCLPLLEQPASDLARAAALNLLKAEVLRATWLAEAAAVLRGESSMTRRRIPVERLVSRVLQAVEPERSLRGVVLERQATASHGDVAGDEERLVCALSGAVMATMELVEGSAAPVSVIARTDPEDSFVFSVAQSSAGAPPAWGTRVSDAPTIAGAGGIGAVALAAARRIVEACGGSLTVESVEFGSEIQVVLPRVS